MVTLDNLDSLLLPDRKVSECKATEKQLACSAASGKTTGFKSWKVPESKEGDGDSVGYSLLGTLAASPRWVVVKAEVGHDAPVVILWDKRTGGMIATNPGNHPVYLSPEQQTLVIHENAGEENEVLHLWTNLAGNPQKTNCVVRLPATDAARSGGSGPATRPLKWPDLASFSQANCENSPLETRVPDYLLQAP